MNHPPSLRALLLLLLPTMLLAISARLQAQSDTISALTSTDGEYLIREVFLGGGECFEVSNIQLRGEVGQAGVFTNGSSSIGFAEGIILSNGNVEEIMGPNIGINLGDPNTLSTNYGVTSADPDLVILSELEGNLNPNFFDPVVLEFDFVPTLDSISFEFVFASEEYCQYSLSTFIDLFGFFIDGPGLNGPFTNNGINIAVVPETNQAITAQSINPFFNNTFYRNNIPPGQIGCSLNQPAPASDFNAFNGFTVPLVASARVIPCETYHLKLVVSDRGFDPELDAAVFLKANSFAAGLTSRVASQVTGPSQSNDSSYEGCGSTSIIFTRGDSVLTDDLTVFYSLLPSSTATAGLDYTALPDSIVIPAGVFADTVVIDFFSDNIIEGTETFTLKLRNPCDCSESELTIYILETQSLTGSILGPSSVCSGDGLELAAIPIGGTGDISYQWPNGDQDSIFNIVPMVDDTIQLIISDECGATDTLYHMVHVQSPAGLLDGDFVLCDGRPNVALPITLTDGSSFSFDFLSNGSPTTYTNISEGVFQIPITNTGVYEITNLSADGCTGSTDGEAQVLVVDITTTTQVDTIDCFGAANGGIELFPSGGTGVYTYIWSHQVGLDTAIVNDLDIGTYNAFINDSNGCLDTISVTLGQPDLLEVTIDTLNLFADCQSLGSLEGQVSGGITPYSYAWSDGNMNALNDNLVSGAYDLIVTDANNCTNTLSTTIIGDSILPVVLIDAIDSLDCATSSITLDASNSSQGSNYSYQWTDATNTIIPAPNPLMLSVTTPDTYTLSIVDNDNNCSATTSIQVDVYSSDLNPMIGGAASLSCLQDTVQLSVANPDPDWAFSWEDINGTSLLTNSPTLSVSTPDTYVLIATQNGTSCTGRDTIIVTGDFIAPEVMLANLPDTLDCDLNQVDIDVNILNGSGNYSFQWDGPMGGINGSSQVEDITVLEPGDYQLIAEDITNGCRDTLLSTVFEDLSSLTIDPIPDTLLNCFFPTLNLTATSPNTGNLSFSWENPSGMTISQTANAQINTPGTYLVMLSDADNGCTQTTQFQVAIDTLTPRVIPDLPGDIDCNNETVTLSTSSGPANYTPIWRNAMGDILPSTTWEQTVDQAGGYSLTIRDEANGCRSTILFDVGIDTIAPIVNFNLPDTLTCSIDTIDINSNISNGPGDYSYQWNGPGGGIVSPSDLSDVAVVLAGNYSLITTDQRNGCADTLQTIVTEQREIPVFEPLNDTLINCYQPSIVITGNSNSPGSLSFGWYDESQTLLSSNADLMVDQEGTYTLSLINNDNDCSNETNINVSTNFTAPNANAGDDVSIGCLDINANLQGEAGPINWVPNWVSPDGTPISTGSWELTTNLTGNFQLNVIDTLNGCTANDIVNVALDQDAPTAEAGPAINILDCFTGNAVIDLSNSSQGVNIIYTILDAAGVTVAEGVLNNFTTSTPGNYELVVTNTDNDCQSSDIFNVVIEEPSIETLITNNIACGEETGSIVFDEVSNGSPPYLYSIDGGDNFVGAPVFLNLPIGTYDLVVQDINGCEVFAVTSISQATGINIFLEEQVELKLGEQYTLEPLFDQAIDQIASIQWSSDPQLSCTDCLNPVFTAQQTTFLELFVTDVNGCSSKAKILLLVDETVPVYVPNVFSPNNVDGINDRFTIYGDPQQITEIVSLNIFDRWGGLVFVNQNFQVNDPSQGWDGKTRGKRLNKAIFVYWAELRLQNGETIIIEGDVLLMD
ncbi:choice-of-anchor L domain-containing protein [Lewinella cohaerens]|uniref:choice-of-anchor L domain-containing protein n=1 Tax=Lewinella cohaerens TaxID=70995 RepID=UPI00037C4E8A|nr:choice-of-anchor L domain-containing protein [Lewinella cohaerens]